MEKYESYGIDDFLGDDLFIDWVFSSSEQSEAHWNRVFARYPTIKADAEEAKKLLLSIRIQPNKPMPSQIRKEIIAHILANANTESSTKYRKNVIRTVKGVRWLAAACVLLFIGLALYFSQDLSSPTKKPNDLVFEQPNDKPTQQKVINISSTPLLLMLPDKSTVILAPKSHIVYEETTFTETREIHLIGEAFFEVQNQENTPFMVKTDHLVAKVLGTSFRIQAFDDDTEHRVTVNTGLVQVQKAKEDETAPNNTASEGVLYVSANQEAVYDIANVQLMQTDIPQTAIPEKAPLSKEAVETLFDFQSTPLETVLTTLGERYQITIQLDNPILASRTITASLSDLHLYEKLDLISKAAEASYQIEDGRIKFTSIETPN